MAKKSGSAYAEVGVDGRLILPSEVAEAFGLVPGARVRVDADGGTLRLHRPTTQLSRIYVEPTNRCNLDCVTCYRHNWHETLGRMSDATFERILAGVAKLQPKPTLFFGGVGEPTLHTRLVSWIAQAHALGCRVELITNGTLLTESTSRRLIEAGLDLLWVSIDGATPESYADVRLGAQLPTVLENIQHFANLRDPGPLPKPEIGVAFVAMDRNFDDLPEVLRIARERGASRVKVSNVLATDVSLDRETLYDASSNDAAFLQSVYTPRLSLPQIPINTRTKDVLARVFSSGYHITFAGSPLDLAGDVCEFVASGSMAIGWAGDVSPCLPLMHTHSHPIKGYRRTSHAHIVGNINVRGLLELWRDPGYVSYRNQVQTFDFAPCTACGGCDLLESNDEDCMGNLRPTCGACLWAQGLVQCP